MSSWGVFDMVGGLYEWVADWSQGNANPWAATAEGATTNAAYGTDYMSGVNPAGRQGGGANFPVVVVRGASHFDTTGAGVFALSLIARTELRQRSDRLPVRQIAPRATRPTM